jgi:hypothetical protein
MRLCQICLQEKPLKEYREVYDCREELHPWCNSCLREYNKIQYNKLKLKRQKQKLSNSRPHFPQRLKDPEPIQLQDCSANHLVTFE